MRPASIASVWAGAILLASSMATPLAAQDEPAQAPDPSPSTEEAVKSVTGPVTSKALVEAGGTAPTVTKVPEGEIPGLSALQAQGIQGAPLLAIVVNEDGTITDPRIVEPSPSPELDQIALEHVMQFEMQPGRDAEGNAVAVEYTAPMPLYKDSAADGSLAEKTCGDFVLDADWFLNAHPESTIKDMRLWSITVGLFVLANPGGSLQDRIWPARTDPLKVYERCAKKPKKNFLKTFRKVGR